MQGHRDFINSLAFDNNGKLLASGCDRTIKLWDLQTYKLKSTLKGHKYSVLSVAFNNDGLILASGSRDLTI